MKTIKIKNLLEYKPVGQKHLCGKYIPKAALTMLVGPSDTGKSTFARQLAMAIATGQTEMLGEPINAESNKVLVICTEDDTENVKEITEKQMAGMQITEVDSIDYAFGSEVTIKEICDYINKEKPSLVIIDGIADLFKEDPNNLVKVRAFLNPLTNVANDNKTAIVLLHHNVKNSEKGQPSKNMVNGSQAWEAKCRSVIELRNGNNDDEKVLTITKGNYVEQKFKNKPAGLKFNSSNRLFELPTNPSSILLNSGAKTTYEPETWLTRYKATKVDGMSIDKTINALKAAYPDDKIPSKTWWVEILKAEKEITLKNQSANPENVNQNLTPVSA